MTVRACASFFKLMDSVPPVQMLQVPKSALIGRIVFSPHIEAYGQAQGLGS